MQALRAIDDWPVDRAAAAVVMRSGDTAAHGVIDHVFALASVTKLLVAYATLIAVEEESLALDDPAGPSGSTVRHLLAHASGLAADGDVTLAPPGTRRIYSNAGFEELGRVLTSATGVAVRDYVQEAVCAPIGMRATHIAASAATGASSSVADLARFVGELLRPTLVAPETLRVATTVAFPGLDGVLPGFGKQSPNDWGLGFELRDGKHPHWTGGANSPATFGHFGQSGTMCWIDPDAELGLVCLTDRSFGPWAMHAWPALSDAVLGSA